MCMLVLVGQGGANRAASWVGRRQLTTAGQLAFGRPVGPQRLFGSDGNNCRDTAVAWWGCTCNVGHTMADTLWQLGGSGRLRGAMMIR